MRDAALVAQPFDASTESLTGEPRLIARPIDTGISVRFAAFSAAGRVVVRRRAADPNGRLVWVSREGATIDTFGGEIEQYRFPALSRDGTKLIANTDQLQSAGTIWWFDLARNGVRDRLTTVPGLMTIWLADGRAAFSQPRSNGWAIYLQSLGGTAPTELFSGPTPLDKRVRDATAEHILLADSNDLWLLPLDGGAPRRFMQTPSEERHARISPDGRWVAYSAIEAGESNVYLTAFPEPGARLRVSPGGGADPQWRADGKELYYVAQGGALMAVGMDTDAANPIGRSERLFERAFHGASLNFGSVYAPQVDAQTFIIVDTVDVGESDLFVTLDWAPQP